MLIDTNQFQNAAEKQCVLLHTASVWLLKIDWQKDKDMTRPTTIFLLAIITTFTCSLPAIAEEELIVTLEQAVQLALQNNPTALQATEAVTVKQADVTGAVGDFLPTLSASLRGYQQYDSGQQAAGQTTQSNSSPGLFSRDFGGMDITATTNITIFDGLSNVASLKGARLERDAATATKSWTEQSLALEVATRYFQVLRSREWVALERKQLEQNRLQLEKIENFYQAGKVSVTDLYQQKAEMSQAKKQLLEAENALNINRLLLVQVLGLPESTSLSVVQPEKASNSFLSSPDSYEDAYSMAIANRADLVSQNLTLKARAQDVTKSYSGYWPTIDLFASIGTGFSSMDGEPSYSDQFTEDKVVGVFGVMLSIPIFDGLDTYTATTKAKAQRQIAELERIELEQQASVELLQAIEDYKTAVAQVEVAKSLVEATSLALEAMVERYNVHASTLLELTSARTAYFEARYENIDAIYTRTEKRLSVAYQKGNLMDTLDTLYKGANQ